MNQVVAFPEAEKWAGIDSFLEDSAARNLTAGQRLILTGGGTLTATLQALSNSPIHIDVIRQQLLEADPGSVRFLEMGEIEKGLFREVWILNNKNEKLVYAVSFLPLTAMNPSIYEALMSGRCSIGDLIETMNLPSCKDKIGFGKIQSEFLSKEFKALAASHFWYRHYRLASPKNLLASIFEVFSPTAFDMKFS